MDSPFFLSHPPCTDGERDRSREGNADCIPEERNPPTIALQVSNTVLTLA